MSLDSQSIKSPETVEQFPSQAEIKEVFEFILKGQKYEELKIVSDENSVSLYEVEAIFENGEKIELNFQKAKYNYRDPSLPTSARFSASIHAVYYDTDGMPCDGDCVANYLDGKWDYVS